MSKLENNAFAKGETDTIPLGWIETTLGEVLLKKGYIRGPFGSALKRGEMKKEGVPVYEQANAIYNHRKFRYFIDKSKHEKLSRFSLKCNDILSACSGTFGRTTIIREEDPIGIISQALLILRSDKEKIDENYFNYYLNSQEGKEKLIDVSHGSVQVNIAKRKDVEAVELLLPSIKEQKSIAEVLSAFDYKIQLLQAQNKTLETLAQTLFKYWFGKYQVDDELPNGWKIKTIEELVEKIIDYRGKTPKKLGMDWSESGIPALSAKTIKKGKIVRRDAMNFGSQALYDIWMKDELQKGDILLTSEAPLGEMYYINDDKKYILSQRLFALRVNDEVTSQYLYHYLFSRYGQHLLQARASGSTVQGIRQSELRKIEVIVPDNETLSKTSLLFQNVFDKKHNNSKQIQFLKKTRDELLPKLMSGKIRIKEFVK